MKTYILFLIKLHLRSFLFVLFISSILILILNILTELDFFGDLDISLKFIIFLSLLNLPNLIFEMFPFIFLISTQLFFINLFTNNEMLIFKYFGLKNTKIISIIAVFSFILSLIITIFFYNFSSNLQNYYLELKSKYTSDGKYLAVITNNGLWIKDEFEESYNIINAEKIEENKLINVFISEFNKDFVLKKNINSELVDISENNWKIYNPKIFEEKKNYELDETVFKTNFNYNKIKNLFSNLASLNLIELLELRKNYMSINYSIIEIDMQIFKILTYPLYLVFMSILASIIMFKIKAITGNGAKISIGLLFSVVIYYINNVFYVMGNTEKLSLTISILAPLIMLAFLNYILIFRINEK